MSQTEMALLIVAVLVPLWIFLRQDFIRGLAYAVVILLTFTPLVRIETPGDLPELPLQRLIILSLAVAWMRHPHRRSLREVPFAGLMAGWAGVALISLVGAVDLVAGVKRYLEFVFELFVFYFILATTLHSREDALRLLRAAVLALSIVATLAIVERYTGLNMVDRFIGQDPESRVLRDVRVTYRHRILLGAGLAMAFPLAAAMTQLATKRLHRLLAWLAFGAMAAGCYFSMSRGPWLALILAALVLIAFGGRALRKPLMVAGVAVVLVLLSHPGVYGTLFNKAADTVDTDSFKGGTFQYRLELYSVAYEGIKRSPWRLCFGNGPAAGLHQSIEWELSYRGKNYNIASWDNDFAYALFQYGFLGLAVTLALYGRVAGRLLVLARQSSGRQRDLFVCLCASALALFFMMSNVHIFARQLYYLFWTVAAVGFTIAEAATKPEARSFPRAEIPGEDWLGQAESPTPEFAGSSLNPIP